MWRHPFNKKKYILSNYRCLANDIHIHLRDTSIICTSLSCTLTFASTIYKVDGITWSDYILGGMDKKTII